MILNPADLSFVLFSPQNLTNNAIPHYEHAYHCWKKVWTETLLELDGDDRIYSDDFTRQNTIGCIVRNETCLGLAFLNFLDFKIAPARQDSYFNVWSDQAIEKLLEDGTRVAVGSNITVDEEFRGDMGIGIKIKNIVLGMIVKTMLNHDVDVMTGTMRRNRGMQDSAYHFGATPVGQTIHHGVDVDLVAFYRKRILNSKVNSADLILERLWRTRKDFRTPTVITRLKAKGV
jgi:hypothetical protein